MAGQAGEIVSGLVLLAQASGFLQGLQVQNFGVSRVASQ